MDGTRGTTTVKRATTSGTREGTAVAAAEEVVSRLAFRTDRGERGRLTLLVGEQGMVAVQCVEEAGGSKYEWSRKLRHAQDLPALLRGVTFDNHETALRTLLRAADDYFSSRS